MSFIMVYINFVKPSFSFLLSSFEMSNLHSLTPLIFCISFNIQKPTLKSQMKVPVLWKKTDQKSKRYAIFFVVLSMVIQYFGLRYFYSSPPIVPQNPKYFNLLKVLQIRAGKSIKCIFILGFNLKDDCRLKGYHTMFAINKTGLI